MIERVGLSVLAIVGAGLVACSRIYLNYHTTKQVLVGCFAGVVSAFGWFLVTSITRQAGLVQWCLDLYIVRFFRVRDLVVEEDLCQAGWEKWEAKKMPTAGSKKRK